jgi:hypothetical protein
LDAKRAVKWCGDVSSEPSIEDIVRAGEPDAVAAAVNLGQRLQYGGDLTHALDRFGTATPFAIGALTCIAARRLFGREPDIRAVTAYVREVSERGVRDWPRREMEAVIRGVLGEPEVGARVPRGSRLSVSAARQLIPDAFAGARVSEAGLRDIFEEIGVLLRISVAHEPRLAVAADQWDRVCRALGDDLGSTS